MTLTSWIILILEKRQPASKIVQFFALRHVGHLSSGWRVVSSTLAPRRESRSEDFSSMTPRTLCIIASHGWYVHLDFAPRTTVEPFQTNRRGASPTLTHPYPIFSFWFCGYDFYYVHSFGEPLCAHCRWHAKKDPVFLNCCCCWITSTEQNKRVLTPSATTLFIHSVCLHSSCFV